MYFAMDNGDVTYLSQALFEQLKASPVQLNWYALLDTGFDHGRRKLRLPGAVWPLYFEQEWGELREVSPLLIERPQEDQAALRKLLRHCQGRPMLSFVASRLDAQALRAAWQRCLRLSTADGQGYLLRFADTRISANLPRALSLASWQRLCAPLDHWLIVDRTGRLQALTPPPRAMVTDEDEDWVLSDRELAALLQAAQADILADRLHDEFAELLPESGALLHDWLQRACAVLSEYHIESVPDQLALAVTVCCSQGAGLDDPRLHSVLATHAAEHTPLDEALAQLLETPPRAPSPLPRGLSQ